MDEQEAHAIRDLLRTVRIGVIVIACIYGGVNITEMTGVI